MPTVKTSKEEILRKSTMLIWQQGYKHTSFSDLSRACNIRSAHFYYYFKDKEDLMCQILENSRQYFKAKIFSVAFQDEISAAERLKIMIKKLNVLYTISNGGCMFGNMVLENAHTKSPFLDIIRMFFHEFIEALTHIYLDKLDEQQAKQKALQTVQQLEGAIMLMRLFNDKSYVDNAWQNAFL